MTAYINSEASMNCIDNVTLQRGNEPTRKFAELSAAALAGNNAISLVIGDKLSKDQVEKLLIEIVQAHFDA